MRTRSRVEYSICMRAHETYMTQNVARHTSISEETLDPEQSPDRGSQPKIVECKTVKKKYMDAT